MNTEEVFQTENSQGTAEPIEGITPVECSREHMNTEEVLQEENREASPIEGTSTEEKTPTEKIGFRKRNSRSIKEKEEIN